MNHDAIRAFSAASRGGERLIGIDLGTKTIGLALSDLGRQIATPLETIRRVKFTPDAQRLAALCRQHAVGGLVVGLPLNMDGSEGPRAEASRAFAVALEKATGLPVEFWDERLSTVAATRTLLEADLSRAKRKEVIDQMAAQFILQGWLDAQAARAGGADYYDGDDDEP